VLAVTRHRAVAPNDDDVRRGLEQAVAALRRCEGFRSARLGRAVDDGALWVLVTEWADIRAYRRALSSMEVRLAAVPMLAQAEVEPTAFELLLAADSADPDGDRRADSVRGPAADTPT
jgi:quinol monooxygenase YgiN